jgi:hypothetical protein
VNELALRAEGDALAEVMRELRSRPALRRLRLVVVGADELPDFETVALPALERLELVLDAAGSDYSADAVRHLGLSALPALRELDLRGSTLANLRRDHAHATPLRALAATQVAARLEWLGLPALHDEDRGRIAELARAFPRLRELAIDECASSIEAEARRELRALVVAPRAPQQERPGQYDSLGFSPDDALLITGGDATIWDAATCAPVARLGWGRGRAAFTRDGSAALALVDAAVRVFDRRGAPRASLTPPCDVADFAIACDGAVVVGTDHTVALWPQLGDPEPRWRVDIGEVWASSVLVSLDGKWIACGLRGKTLAIIDRERGALERVVTDWLRTVAMPAHGSAIGWRVADGAIVPLVAHVPGVRAGPLGGCVHAVSRDGATIALVRRPRGRGAPPPEHIELYDAARGEPCGQLALAGATVDVMAWSHDGRRLAIAGGGAITIVAADATTESET